MRAMKDSGVEWLGEVPEAWDVQPLWVHFRRTKKTGFPDETLLSAYRDHGVVPKNSRSDNHNVESVDLNGYQLVEDRDLVVNKMKAWQGSLSISKIRGIVSPAYYVFSPESASVSGGYIHNLLRCLPYVLSYSLISKGVRVGQWDLQPELFRKTPVLVPPMKEQLEIASYLDQETSQIDALISKKEQLIEKLLERRQALITQVVTKGLDPHVPMKDSGFDWLGEVPESWSVTPLGKVLSSAVVDGPHTTPEFVDTGLPFLSVDAIVDGQLLQLETRLVSSSDFASFRKKARPQKGDILMGKAASIGKIARVKTDWEFAIWSPLALLKIDSSKADSGFIEFALKSDPIQFQINSRASANTQQNLSMSKIPTLKIALPPRGEQSKIAEYLENRVSATDVVVERIRQSITLLKERRQALITQVVTGKIDVRGFTGGDS